eukprot:4845373-Ditylum_brightwellii.AAC.1
MEAINKTLLLLKSGGQAITVANLNKHVVVKNLPGQVAVKYNEQGSKKLTQKDAIKEKSKEIEEADDLNKKIQ